MWLAVLLTFHTAAAPRLVERRPAARQFDQLLKPQIKKYGLQEGLPDSTVDALAVGGDGRLWVGTDDGLAVFDGHEFRAIRFPAGEKSRKINAVLATEQKVWCGTPGGLFEVDITASSARRVDGFDTPVFSLSLGADDALLIGMSGEVRTLHSERFAHEGDVNVLSRREARVWAGSTHGLAMTLGGALSSESAGLPDHEIRSILQTPHDAWIGTEHGVARRQGDTFKIVEAVPRTTISAFSYGKLGPDEHVWVGTYGEGLYELQGETWSHLDEKRGLPSNRIRSLLFTYDAEVPLLWIGTDVGLLQMVVTGGWQGLVDVPDGLAGQPVNAVENGVAGQEDDFWFSTDQGLGRWTPGEWQKFVLDNDTVVSLQRIGGELWAGTLAGAVYAWRGERWIDLGLPADGAQNSVWGAAGTPKNAWVARRQGLYHRQQERWQRQPTEGLASSWFWSVAVDDDTVFAGTTEGAWFSRAGRGTALLEGLPNPGVASLLVESGRYWLGTTGGGVALVDHTNHRIAEVLSDHSEPALPNGFVYGLIADLEHRVYLTTNRGVVRVSSDRKTLRHFTFDDGLLSEEFRPSAARRRKDGAIVLGSAAGAVVYWPERELEEKTARPLLMTEQLVNRQAVSDLSQLTYDQNQLTFRYNLLSYTHSRQVSYRTQLVGLEAEPSEWAPDQKREFTGLNDGRYELRVWAKDHAGNVSGPVVRSFGIPAAPWRTWWAYALYGAGVAGAVFVGVRVRIKQLQQRAKELEETIANRTAEIRYQKAEIEKKHSALEEAHVQSDRIFQALKQAMPGKIIDNKYQLGQLLGEGGFGSVYLGTEVRTNDTVAVKIFKPQAGNDSGMALERFKQEAKSAMRIDHPHAVRVFDTGVSDDGIAYIVMEMLVGSTLNEAMKEAPKVPFMRALDITAQVADVLASAHDVGLIHRDIKPDNVFLTKQEDGKPYVKVLDFGVAKLMKGDVAQRSMTMTGGIVGTPTYMAPERLQDEEYDGRSDVYAAGIMLYEMLAGRPPFESTTSNVFSVVMAHLSTAPPLLTTFDASIPEWVQQVVMIALEKSPLKRPTAREYHALVMQALRDHPSG